jgi:DNA-binding transcriptional ArsR family regulator
MTPSDPALDAVFATLAHPARRHVLRVIWVHGGAMTAGQIAARFAHAWPTTTRHLGVLEDAGLLAGGREGRTRVYRLNDAALRPVRDWLRWFDGPPPEPLANPAAPDPVAVVRNIALAYPEAREASGRNERIIRVRSRPFLLLREAESRWGLTVNLPLSRTAALKLPFASPVLYRLGKSDWVTAEFGPGDDLPLEVLWEWVDESYRAVAPRRLRDVAPAPPGGRAD